MKCPTCDSTKLRMDTHSIRKTTFYKDSIRETFAHESDTSSWWAHPESATFCTDCYYSGRTTSFTEPHDFIYLGTNKEMLLYQAALLSLEDIPTCNFIAMILRDQRRDDLADNLWKLSKVWREREIPSDTKAKEQST